MNTLPSSTSEETTGMFRLAVEHASDHIIITDANGIILYANPAVIKTTGYSPDEVVGKKPSVWGHQMPREFYRLLWEIIGIQKQPFNGHITNRRKNNQLYDADVHISPVLDAQGGVRYFVGVERDITKEIELDRVKSDFISIASHQLRTPLTSLRWLMEMLADPTRGTLSQSQQALLAKMMGSMKQILDIVTALLDMSRLESGKLRIVSETVHLESFIKSVLDEVKLKYEEKKQHAEMSIRDGLDTVSFDPKLIRNVYVNLMTNAIKYSPDGKHITVTVYKKEGNFITEIKDEGYGIPQDEHHRIFQRFFRARNITRLETDGTGLGLYLVQSIVTTCGGTIWFESKEGVGTTFSFSLPLSPSISKTNGEVSLEPFS
jgi:PAS domain S-box-containing protein